MAGSVVLETRVYFGNGAWTIDAGLKTEAPCLPRFPRCYISDPLHHLLYKAHLRGATQSSQSLTFRLPCCLDSLLTFYILVFWVHYNIT